MTLELHPMTEADIPEFVRVQALAFRNTFSSMLTPNATSPEQLQKTTDRYLKYFADPNFRYVKVIDTDLNGKMIAGARWQINELERTQEQIESQSWHAGDNNEGTRLRNDFKDFLSDARKKWMGTKPHYLLHIIATHPEHHRRGAGAMLLKWGIERADLAQLPAYLEASEEGKSLYARYGFETVENKQIDLSEYGGEGVENFTVMIRPAKQKEPADS